MVHQKSWLVSFFWETFDEGVVGGDGQPVAQRRRLGAGESEARMPLQRLDQFLVRHHHAQQPPALRPLPRVHLRRTRWSR